MNKTKINFSDVSISKCNAYNYEEIYNSILNCVNSLGGIDSFVKKGDKVLLKPNLYRPDIKGTTNPLIVKSIAEILKDTGAYIFLTDSPMIHPLEEVADYTGISDICKDLEIKMKPLTSIKKTELNYIEKKHSFYLPKLLDEMDVIINLPKIKSHPLTVFSGSIKNLFGLCIGLTKSQFHLKYKHGEDFSNMLLDLYSTIKPQLTIMDAVYGVDSTLKSKKVGVILASRDALALDATACRLIAIPVKEVPTLKYGKEKKIGQIDQESIRLLGEDIIFPIVKNFEYEINHKEKLSSFTSTLFDSFFLRNSFAKPYITNKCVLCRKCINICPKNTIVEKNKKANIIYSDCIRCYCCYEICPNDALLIRSINPLFFKISYIFQRIVFILRSFESKKEVYKNKEG